MQALQGLKRLGFTEYEAKIYLALLRHPGSNGYEAARHSGVPRAKVYEVLEGLVQRGAVLAESGEERTVYRALSHAALLQEYRRSAESLVADLYRDLSRYVQAEPGPSAGTVTGYGRIMARAADLAGGARQTLMLAGRPEELMLLGPHLAEAERRGVAVTVVSRGPVRLNVSEVYVQAGRKAEAGLALVVDGAALLLAEVGPPEGGFATLVRAGGTAQMVAGWIRREIALGELERTVGERLGDLLPAVAVQQIQRLLRL